MSALWRRAYGVVAGAIFALGACICFGTAITLDKCDRSCISDGLATGTRVASVAVGLFVLFAAFAALSLWSGASNEKRARAITTGIAAVIVFAAWLFIAGIIVSAPSH